MRVAYETPEPMRIVYEPPGERDTTLRSNPPIANPNVLTLTLIGMEAFLGSDPGSEARECPTLPNLVRYGT